MNIARTLAHRTEQSRHHQQQQQQQQQQQVAGSPKSVPTPSSVVCSVVVDIHIRNKKMENKSF